MTFGNQNLSIHAPVFRIPISIFIFQARSLSIKDNFKYNFCNLFISVMIKILKSSIQNHEILYS